MNWLNRQQLLTIVRSNGFTVTWSGPTTGWVTVTGTSSGFDANTFQFISKSFSCTGPAAPGSLPIPGNIASHVDASNAATFQFGQLSVEAIQLYPIPGTGLDVAVFAFTDSTTQDTDFR
ncbi:MAG: hypothetical protein GY953_56065 [bacterium]|nr:hypothetical protein [bacterium]